MVKPTKPESNDASPAERLEDAFVATLSHEIRTPLNGILGMASLLAETELSPSQSEYVVAIRESGARLLDLLNNVLDYARLGAEEIALENTVIHPHLVAQEVAELLSPRAHARELSIAFSYDESVPESLVIDGGRLRQILFNLVGNAIKFTETGGVLIDMHMTHDDQIRFVVSDTGAGIPEDKQQDLFKAFRQNSAEDAQKDSGVGLGLAIVAQLVEAMGGTIAVDSHLGVGSRFIVDIPIKSPESRVRTATDASINVALIGLPTITAWATARKLLAEGLRVSHYTAPPSDETIRNRIVLVDAALPAKTVQRISEIAPCLVVLRPEDRTRIEHFQGLGCAGYLIRPLRARSLVEQIEQAARGQSVHDGTKLTPGDNSAGRVLIADDNPVNALLAKRSLEAVGYTCASVSTGREATEEVQRAKFDLILMDLRMPIMDGFSAMKHIRSLGGPVSDIPIIAVSAEVNPDIEQRALAAGASAVASKPLDAERLRSIVGKWSKAVNTSAA